MWATTTVVLLLPGHALRDALSPRRHAAKGPNEHERVREDEVDPDEERVLFGVCIQIEKEVYLKRNYGHIDTHVSRSG